MTGHERCEAAIANKPVDRLPTYLPGISCEVASKLLGRQVYTGTGSVRYAEVRSWMDGDDAHAQFVEDFYKNLTDVFRLLKVDVFRMPWRETSKPTKQIDEYTFLFGDPDGAHWIGSYDPASGEFGGVPGAGRAVDPEVHITDYVDKTNALLASEEGLSAMVSQEDLDLWKRFGDEFYYVTNGGGMGIGVDGDRLIMTLTHPDLLRRYVMVQAERAIAVGKALAKTDMPRVLIAGGDMAGNDGPMYSPDCFRRIMLPGLTRAMAGLKEVGVHYVFRTDGNTWQVADMMFDEAGCPGYGEVDRDVGMTVGALRERFPKLVIWGNVASSKLSSESVSWVREERARVIEESGGTGYFHGPSNAILKGTPPENVLAMFGVD